MSFNPSSNPVYREGMGDEESLSNLPELTQLVSGRAGPPESMLFTVLCYATLPLGQKHGKGWTFSLTIASIHCSEHLLSLYYISGHVLHTLHIICYWIFMTVVCGRHYYYLCFIDVKPEVIVVKQLAQGYTVSNGNARVYMQICLMPGPMILTFFYTDEQTPKPTYIYLAF